MVIEQFYGKLLEACGLATDEAGSVYIPDPDGIVPMTVGGKNLVLPTREVLSAAEWKTNIAFHPCSESIIRKESIILKKLRELIVARTYLITSELMLRLMQMAVDVDCHKSMSPEQSNYLSELANVDAKTMKALTSVINASSRDGDHRLISLFIKRSGLWNAAEYRRVAVVTFPILDAHANNEAQIFGVKMRKGDKTAILSLFEYIFPDSRILGKYNFGSNEMAAPNFHTLGYAFAGLLEKLNDKVSLFKEFIPDADELLSNLDWVDGMDSIAKYRAVVPALAGNDGEPLDDGKQQGVEVKPDGLAQMRDINEVPQATEARPTNVATPTKPKAPARPQIGFTPPPNVKAVGSPLTRQPEAPLQPVYSSAPQQSNQPARHWNDPPAGQPAPQEPRAELIGYDLNGQPVYGIPAPINNGYQPQPQQYQQPPQGNYGGYQPQPQQYQQPQGNYGGYQSQYSPQPQQYNQPQQGYVPRGVRQQYQQPPQGYGNRGRY